jgi:spermidine synthase/SAM-dependent methyltransferase
VAMNSSDVAALARQAWNEAAPIHRQATFERLKESFSGSPQYTCLDEVHVQELRRIGIAGRDVGQFNCNNGRELISVRRLGARRCIGFDISDDFVGQARELAEFANVDCSFVQTSIYDIPEEYSKEFDLIFVTAGALCFMPDLGAYLRTAARLLRPGGAVTFYESHPIVDMFRMDRDRREDPLKLEYSYFDAEPMLHTAGLDYQTQTTYDAKPIYYFHHTLASIVMACINEGLCIEMFAEMDSDPSLACRSLEESAVRPPLGFILTARKSAAKAQEYVERTAVGVTMTTPIGGTRCRIRTALDQEFHIFDSPGLGWVMYLNGQLQNSELDDIYYHEIMAHVPMMGHGKVHSALIIGGASGGLAREILKYPGTTIQVVEIDGEVAVACGAALPDIATAFQDSRVSRLIVDGREYLRDAGRRYDTIFLDIPDLEQSGPVGTLAASEVLDLASRALAPRGIAVCQASVPFHGNEKVLRALVRYAKRDGRHWGVFGTLSPLFPGGFQMFIWWSRDLDLAEVPATEIERRCALLSIPTRFYDSRVHVASVALASRLMEFLALDEE